jgi:hypothetical protein
LGKGRVLAAFKDVAQAQEDLQPSAHDSNQGKGGGRGPSRRCLGQTWSLYWGETTPKVISLTLAGRFLPRPTKVVLVGWSQWAPQPTVRAGQLAWPGAPPKPSPIQPARPPPPHRGLGEGQDGAKVEVLKASATGRVGACNLVQIEVVGALDGEANTTALANVGRVLVAAAAHGLEPQANADVSSSPRSFSCFFGKASVPGGPCLVHGLAHTTGIVVLGHETNRVRLDHKDVSLRPRRLVHTCVRRCTISSRLPSAKEAPPRERSTATEKPTPAVSSSSASSAFT